LDDPAQDLRLAFANQPVVPTRRLQHGLRTANENELLHQLFLPLYSWQWARNLDLESDKQEPKEEARRWR